MLTGAERAFRSVVLVETDMGGAQLSVGAGVIVDQTDLVVTNQHVTPGHGAVRVTFSDGRRACARRLAQHVAHDLTALRIDGRGGPPMAWTSGVRRGDPVMVVGNPDGAGKRMTFGRVLTLDQVVHVRGAEPDDPVVVGRMITATAPVRPGNSGGALCDRHGRLAGVIIGSGAADAAAIPAARVQAFLQHVVHGAAPRSGRLGVAGEFGRQCWIVRDVLRASPAAQAGLRAGDLIVALDNHAIDEEATFGGWIRGSLPGDRLRLRVRRGGREFEKMVQLA